MKRQQYLFIKLGASCLFTIGSKWFKWVRDIDKEVRHRLAIFDTMTSLFYFVILYFRFLLNTFWWDWSGPFLNSKLLGPTPLSSPKQLLLWLPTFSEWPPVLTDRLCCGVEILSYYIHNVYAFLFRFATQAIHLCFFLAYTSASCLRNL